MRTQGYPRISPIGRLLAIAVRVMLLTVAGGVYLAIRSVMYIYWFS